MKSKIKSLYLAGGALFIAVTIITFPKEALAASERGIEMWWGTVFPSLLPFFITAELLIAFGVVRFIGVIFEPIMRPLFNVPGVGSFVWAMGMASGYPSGAKITTRLRQENQLTKIEAERLVSFTNASNPLFIIAAVSIGFFNDPKLGILLAVCHYVGNTIVGICMRFYGRHAEHPNSIKQKTHFSILRAFQEMHRTRIADRRPFGKVLGDAVINSVQTLLMIGGFIIMFSVFTNLLYLVGISELIANGLSGILYILGIPSVLGLPILSGMFEITQGAQLISNAEITEKLPQAVAVSFILAFNGLSVQAQVASIIAETDIRFGPYFFARIIHGFISSILTIVLFKPLYLDKQALNQPTLPVFSQIENHSINLLNYLQVIGPLMTIIKLFIAITILTKRRWDKST